MTAPPVAVGEDRELVERLRRRHTCRHGVGGPTTIHHLTNPDGPEAADRLEAKDTEIAGLKLRVGELEGALTPSAETRHYVAIAPSGSAAR